MAVPDQDAFSNISWTSDAAIRTRSHDGDTDRMADDRSSADEGGGGSGGGGGGGSSSVRSSKQKQKQKQKQKAVGGSGSGPFPDNFAEDFAVGHDAGLLGQELLQCRVSSPLTENEGGSNPFTSYLVTTNSTFPSFTKPTVSVRRRFTDFLFLYNSLYKDFPASAVPPIPDKQRMVRVTGDRFGPDFTNRRAYALQRFLARCTLHPVLRRAPILHSFLESSEWNATMRSYAARQAGGDGSYYGSPDHAGGSAGGGGSGGAGNNGGGGGGGGNSVFDAFADSFINVFTKVHRVDRRFVDVREKSDRLDENLGHVEKVLARVVRREADLETDLSDLAEQFQKLLTLEPSVGPAVRAFAASVEDTASGLRGLRDVTDQDYLGSLRDMVAYSGSLKNLLKAREQKQLDYEQLTEYLNKSTADRDALAHSAGMYYPPPPSGGGGGATGGGVTGGGATGTAASSSSSTAAAATDGSEDTGAGGSGSTATSLPSTSTSTNTMAATASQYILPHHGAGAGSRTLSGASGFLRSKLEDVRGVDHEQSRRERQRKLELRVEELTAEVERAKKTSELFDEEVVKEVADFERIKRVEFKRQMGGLADAHVAYYDAVARVWEDYVREMEKEGMLAV